MPTRRRAPSRARRPSGRLLWVPSDLDIGALSGNTQLTVEMFTTLSDADKSRATLLRIVGEWTCRPAGSDQQAEVLVGIYQQTADALSAGANPELELDPMHYLWRDSMALFTGDTLANSMQNLSKRINVRSARKILSQAHRLVIQFETLTAIAVNVGFHLRGLFRVG